MEICLLLSDPSRDDVITCLIQPGKNRPPVTSTASAQQNQQEGSCELQHSLHRCFFERLAGSLGFTNNNYVSEESLVMTSSFVDLVITRIHRLCIMDGCSHEHSDGLVVRNCDAAGIHSTPRAPSSEWTAIPPAIAPRASIVWAVVAPWIIDRFICHLMRRLSLRPRKHDGIGSKSCRPTQDLSLQAAEAKRAIANP